MATLDRIGRGEEVADWLPLHALGTGLIDAPPRANFSSLMDPNERAAARIRAPYGTRAAGPQDQATPEEMAQAALMLAGGPAMRGLMMAPKIATAALGGGAFLSGTDAAGDDTDAVKQLQIKLRDAGLYGGKIDGVMGKATQRAQQMFSEQETARAQRASAEAQTEETRRAGREAEIKREQREQGETRLRDMERDVPWHRRALRDYATPIGIGAGILAGAGARAGVTAASNRLSRSTAEGAESLFASGARGGIPARVARTNEFWRRGGGEVPFTSAPDTAKGFAVNPGATPIGKLYEPPRSWNALTDLGITGVFGAEAALGQTVLVPAAQERLQRATEAAAADPSEVNIRELQAAKDRASMMDALTNFGRAGAISYPASALKMQRAPTKPAMERAESEQLNLERHLRQAPRGRSSSPREQGEGLGDILNLPARPTRLMQPDR